MTEAKDHMEQLHDDYEARRRELINRLRESRHFGAGRLLRAFPEMRHRDHQELIEMIRREIKDWDSDMRRTHRGEPYTR